MFDYFVLAVLVACFATFLTRALPLFIFQKNSANLEFIQKNMPLGIMIILVFYTFGEVNLSEISATIKIFLACAFVFIIHFLFKNALLSIFFGVIFYMAILRLI